MELAPLIPALARSGNFDRDPPLLPAGSGVRLTEILQRRPGQQPLRAADLEEMRQGVEATEGRSLGAIPSRIETGRGGCGAALRNVIDKRVHSRLRQVGMLCPIPLRVEDAVGIAALSRAEAKVMDQWGIAAPRHVG